MEAEFIAWLRSRLPHDDRAELGLSDDAAWLRLHRPEAIVTTDMLMDGVDFRLNECDPRRVGRKALAVNLSDLAAMAARPVAAFVSLALPRHGGLALARELYEGLLPLAESFSVAIAGGDTNSWDGPLVVSVTAVGEPLERGPLRRSGARPGDWLLATGSFGGSILGRHFDFLPRVREALWLHSHYELHAGIDVSDGLSLDLSRMATESGCGAVLDLDAIPIDDAARRLPDQTPLDHALGDGEDFELLLAVPPEEARRLLAVWPASEPEMPPLTRIGEFVPPPGLFSRRGDGPLEPLAPRGYQHELR